MLSIGVLFVLDMILMSFFFFFLKKKGSAPNAVPPVPGMAVDGKCGFKDIASINQKDIFTDTSWVDLKLGKLEQVERSLLEKEKKIESLMNSVEERLKNAAILYDELRSNNDVYGLALRMLRKGSPREEVSIRLGLLTGEVELIESIVNYKAS